MLQPRAARWFEILAARDDATRVLEALARTGLVELQARSGTGIPAELGDVMQPLAQFAELAARYRSYWPDAAQCQPSAFPESPGATLQRARAVVRAWAQDAEPVIRRLQGAEAEAADLQLWQGVLPALAAQVHPGCGLAGAGPLLQVRLFVLPAGVDADAALPLGTPGLETLAAPLAHHGPPRLLVAGPPAALQALAQRVGALKGSAHEVPRWLTGDTDADRRQLDERLAARQAEVAAARAALATLHERHGLGAALGDVARLQWLLSNVDALESGPLFCHITGWCSEPAGSRLAQALHDASVRALLNFPPAPADLGPPLLLVNPPWARPFEIFSRALGMPSAGDADPTPLLAVVVPLMFGYMFGDVGQGLLLAAGGWWYRKRWPVARMLMAGGLVAAGFGLLFGSVFGLHGALPALWLHPLQSPLPVLLAPLFGGALLLTLGLALDGLAAVWHGRWKLWLLTDAALVVLYLALLASFFVPQAAAVAAAAMLWFCIGHAVHGERLGAALEAAGEAVEKTLQILINTLSFARVGAFALAHAGLSSAIVALMDAADSLLAKGLVLVLGNALVMVLEGMVVAIQTTRLVLFEFFTRFMQGQGRAFRALPAPPYPPQET